MSETAEHRLTTVEVEQRQLRKEVHELTTTVKEIRDVLVQAKGFKIPFVVLGTFLIGSAGAVTHWILSKFS